ncbi:MAG: 30S ribosomal protein S2 [Deltaproteobacteria bacterium]|nr:30S ribosomal protein S2 [Deltaproteobacteria bacterium]
MGVISMKALLEAGVHFGHQTSRWNPKMEPYIFGARNGIHVIDLQKTSKLFDQAYFYIRDAVANGEKILFVGTKKQAQNVIVEEADRCSMYYVHNRWLGGTLTNFRTIRQSIDRLKTLKKMEADGDFAKMTKKEALRLKREANKLERNLPGLKEMARLPGLVFIVDPRKERIALAEAIRLKIPVVAITDTNCDPDGIDFVIPGNDDAIRAIKLFSSSVADACIEGQQIHQERIVSQPKERAPKKTAPRESDGRSGGPKVEVVSKSRLEGQREEGGEDTQE